MLTPRSLIRFGCDEHGATAIEYGLIAGLVCLAMLAGLAGTNTSVVAAYEGVMTRVSEALSRN